MPGLPLSCQEGLFLASFEEVPSSRECHLTVFGFGTFQGQKAGSKLAPLSFWSDVGFTLTDFHPSPRPPEM